MNGQGEAELTPWNANGEDKREGYECTDTEKRLQNGEHEAESAQAQFWRGEFEQGNKAERSEGECAAMEMEVGIDDAAEEHGSGGRKEGEETVGRKKACILSIDGGGMRGIIPAKVLCYVEERIKEKSGDPNARLADYFDIVAGTSVGGLIATMVCADDGHGRPLFSAQEACTLICDKGKLIFKIPPLKRPFAKLRGILTPRYSVKNMEAILKEHMVTEDGRERTLKDTLKPLLIPCYDLSRAGAYVFSRAEALKSDSANFRLVDVCRATSAVPGFFRPAIITSVDGKTSIVGVDGGLVMNNPAAAAVAHVLHNSLEFPHVRSVADTLVLSLGTGLFDRSYEADKVKRWGAFQWAKPVARIVLDGISDMVDHSMSMAFSNHRKNYLRVQVSGIPTRCLTEMDDPSRANVRRLTKIAEDMLDQPCIEHIPFGGKRQLSVSNRERLDWFVDCLIAEHCSSRLGSATDVHLPSQEI